jgi:hypothetical protein
MIEVDKATIFYDNRTLTVEEKQVIANQILTAINDTGKYVFDYSDDENLVVIEKENLQDCEINLIKFFEKPQPIQQQAKVRIIPTKQHTNFSRENKSDSERLNDYIKNSKNDNVVNFYNASAVKGSRHTVAISAIGSIKTAFSNELNYMIPDLTRNYLSVVCNSDHEYKEMYNALKSLF